LLDLADGNSMWARTEGYGTVRGESPSPKSTGFRYVLFVDQANAGMYYYDEHLGNTLTEWFHFFIPAVARGDVTSWRHDWEWYLQRQNSHYNDEYGSHMMQAVVGQILNPPAAHLQKIPFNVNRVGGTYTLTWTVPPGAVSCRVKYAIGKNIVDWIGFDPRQNQFTGDPANSVAWFGAEDAAEAIAAGTPGSTQTYVFKGQPGQDYRFDIRVFVEDSRSRNSKK